MIGPRVIPGPPRADAGELPAALRRDLPILARLGVTIGYAQAAAALGLGPPGAIRRLTAALEATMAEDAAAGRPFLAALVVSPRRGGLPAPGFFETARALGRAAPEGGEASFHAAELRALFALHAPLRARSGGG